MSSKLQEILNFLQDAPALNETIQKVLDEYVS
jgi:hypothetical protein